MIMKQTVISIENLSNSIFKLLIDVLKVRINDTEEKRIETPIINAMRTDIDVNLNNSLVKIYAVALVNDKLVLIDEDNNEIGIECFSNDSILSIAKSVIL